MSGCPAKRKADFQNDALSSSTEKRHKAAEGIAQFVTRIIEEAKRLEKAEEAAEELLSSRREALRLAQRELDESLSQLESCRKRKKELVSRGVEMTRRGLDSLDELEEVERAESLQEQLVVEDVNSLVHSDVLDFSFLDFSVADGNPSGVVGRS
ncbi:hypothetical protein FDECE_17563 [Fusarium decemcellulare]|nr:hypothetical protein FDECE_17563 [Fusarium decemcellulare]